jgi:FkbM family methyltransferase
MHSRSLLSVQTQVRKVHSGPPLKRVAAASVRALCAGAARFTLYRARWDTPNNPARNGEYALQRWVLESSPAGSPLTVLDIGANIGNWSRSMLDLAAQSRRAGPVRLHAFEPAGQAYQALTARIPEAARINRLALSDRAGEVELQVPRPPAGRSSLYRGETEAGQTEQVSALTVDSYLDQQGITRVDLMKVDAEGHDLAILRGAFRTLAAGSIQVVQFEYNHRWMDARYFLRDAFNLLVPLGYRVGKLTPQGVEIYPHWDLDLETFVEGNYVAGRRGVMDRMPQVRWWKSCT